jgi:hypothetical protein
MIGFEPRISVFDVVGTLSSSIQMYSLLSTVAIF